MRKHFKRITLFLGTILTVTLITLAFIPHYGCACGEMLKQNGSQLDYLPQTIAEFVFKVIEAVFR